MSLEQIIQLTLLFCVALNLVATFSFSKKKHLALTCFGLAWGLTGGLFALNYLLAQAPPFGNMYHVLSFMPLLVAPLYLYLAKRQKSSWVLPYFSMTAALALTGAFFMPLHTQWAQMPALQSAWFVPHVSSYVLSYALATVGTLLLLVDFLKDPSKKQSLLYQETAYKVFLLAFPFMTFGLWSGALWADEVWGGYWSWDIKEVWSLITWLLYIMYFHFQRVSWGKKWQRPLAFCAYVALLITFLVVNLLPKISSMHSYSGMGS